MDLSKTRLTEADKVRFRTHWKKYCKDISPKKAMLFLWQTFIEMDRFDVKDMYWEWRDEYKESEEW